MQVAISPPFASVPPPLIRRYAQPRKLSTRRGRAKAEQNAWCISCQRPMARHGKNFYCATCHVATRMASAGIRIATCATPIASAEAKPWCLSCRKPFRRCGGERFRCPGCNISIRGHKDRRKLSPAKEREIVGLIQAGHTNKDIALKAHCFHQTVARLRAGVQARLCECGGLFHHKSKCKKRPGWQSMVQERRSTFDDLLVRVNRRIPRGLDEEVRAEVAQQMLADIAQLIDDTLSKSQEYIRRYKKQYPFQLYSLDANRTFAERLVG